MEVSFRFQARDSDLVEIVNSILKLKNIPYLEYEEQDELVSDFTGYKPVTGYKLIINLRRFMPVFRHFKSIIRYYINVAHIKTVVKIECGDEEMEVSNVDELEKAFACLERKCKVKRNTGSR